MLVQRLCLDTHPTHFSYLVACRDTGEAIAIDPGEPDQIVQLAAKLGWQIRHIVNTHEHGPSVEGNLQLKRMTGARVLAHIRAFRTIPGVDEPLTSGAKIRVGRTIEFEVMDTPGHTMSHVCLKGRVGDKAAIFSGCAVVVGGVGDCKQGGDPIFLYQTIRDQMQDLPDDMVIYPSYDQAVQNLKFTLAWEPSNQAAKSLLADVLALADQGEYLTTTIGFEREVNVFMRLDHPEVIASLQTEYPKKDLSTPRKRFLLLRKLRDKFTPEN